MAAITTTRRRRRDWSSLPPDLLVVIINLLPIPSCLRVRAVCRSWSLTPYSPTNPQLPWLVGSTGEGEGGGGDRERDINNFYSLSERRSYRVNLPGRGGGGGGRYLASSRGWIVFSDDEAVAAAATQLLLFNPITRVTLPLPNINPNKLLPYHHKVKLIFAGKNYNNMTVFVLHGQSHQEGSQFHLSYASVGDETWTEINGKGFTDLVDFEFHNGKLYGIHKDTYRKAFHLVDSVD